jgi:hypothetical protein
MPAIEPAASPAAGFTGRSLTRNTNPDNLFALVNAATEHGVFVLQRIQHWAFHRIHKLRTGQ